MAPVIAASTNSVRRSSQGVAVLWSRYQVQILYYIPLSFLPSIFIECPLDRFLQRILRALDDSMSHEQDYWNLKLLSKYRTQMLLPDKQIHEILVQTEAILNVACSLSNFVMQHTQFSTTCCFRSPCHILVYVNEEASVVVRHVANNLVRGSHYALIFAFIESYSEWHSTSHS